MDSGRAFQLNLGVVGFLLYSQAIEESGDMADGDSVWVLWEYIINNAAPANAEIMAGALQGDRNFTTGGWERALGGGGKAAGLAGLKHAGISSAALDIVFVDNNATQTESSVGDGFGYLVDTHYRLALKITRVSSTQVTVTAYRNGVEGATLTHNNAGGIGTLNWKTFRAGNRVATAKGETYQIWLGNVFVSGAAMPGQSDAIVYTLPTSDGATNEWLASGGGAGAFGEWDDAFGSYSTTDYNTSTSTTAAKKTINGFASSSVPSDATVKLVGMNAASSLNGSAIDATRFLGITASATNIEKDITFSGGIATLHTNGAEFRFFEKRGDASAWTPATVDSDTFYVRQGADAAAREWRVYALGKLVWYEPVASATQVGATHMGLGPGVFFREW